MIQYIVKILLTAALVVAVSEISKRNTFLAGLLASLPLVSLLAMIWLYLDTKDTAKVSALSTSIFWLVLPSLVFFLALPQLLKSKLNFAVSLGLAIALMLICYAVMVGVLKRLGVNL